MALLEFKNIRGANKRNSHEHSNARCATADRCRPKKAAPASSESHSRGDPEVGRRSLGPHRPTETYCGADCKKTNRCQVPLKAFLHARRGNNIVSQMRASSVVRKGSPLSRPPRARTLLFTQTESVKH